MSKKSFQLQIGGIPISILSEESVFIELIADKYKAFAKPSHYLTENKNYVNTLKSQTPVKLYLNLRKVDEEDQRKMQDEDLWIKVSYRDNRYIIQRPDLEGEIDLGTRIAKVTNRAAIYSFDSFLRILYSLILVEEGGFLLHAASVIKDGCGYIFMGRSGAGKSSIAFYSTQYTVLSDEISLVRRVGDKYLLYSTPFWGEQEIKGGNFYTSIYGIYQLKQASKSAYRRLQQRESLQWLMQNILYFAKEPLLTRQVFQNCLDFIKANAIYELEFQKDNHFWEVIG